MGLVFTISVYLVVWWTVLFAVLPIGVQSYHEAGIEPPRGADPGAPVNPNLKKKFFTTTWISAVSMLFIWCAYTFHWVHLPPLRVG